MLGHSSENIQKLLVGSMRTRILRQLEITSSGGCILNGWGGSRCLYVYFGGFLGSSGMQ